METRIHALYLKMHKKYLLLWVVIHGRHLYGPYVQGAVAEERPTVRTWIGECVIVMPRGHQTDNAGQVDVALEHEVLQLTMLKSLVFPSKK